MKNYYVYILMNCRNTVLYIGLTNDINRRTYEHKTGKYRSFSKEYGVTKLVYYEIFHDINAAINREKVLKKWRRIWKLELIKSKNPELIDLADDLGNVTNFLMLDAETSSA